MTRVMLSQFRIFLVSDAGRREDAGPQYRVHLAHVAAMQKFRNGSNRSCNE